MLLGCQIFREILLQNLNVFGGIATNGGNPSISQ